ncbi:hypothetical protein JKP88DRAFT_250189 [Tribonema minus]|uniref:Uncharacterized protein n=1 Tax=Tribonema minus TaxID=303371 RepID=A0A835YRX3_9STRA|nr:hypothetical protein JKP88DRAFT_250189 [Tribonema minus]
MSQYAKGNGLLDFFIGEPFSAGLEILCDSKCVDEHYKRFEEGGRYRDMMEDKSMKDFIVIDFIAPTKIDRPRTSRAEHPNLNSVMVAADYASAVVWNKGSIVQEVVIRGNGDEFCKQELQAIKLQRTPLRGDLKMQRAGNHSCQQPRQQIHTMTINAIMFKIITVLVVCLASSAAKYLPATGDFQVSDVGDNQFKFTPQPSKPFAAADGNTLTMSGQCEALGLKGKCTLPVEALNPGGRRLAAVDDAQLAAGDAARGLALPPCDLVNVLIGATEINVLGLVITLPQGLIVRCSQSDTLHCKQDVTGQVGLLGDVLCGLLGGGSLSLGGFSLSQITDLLNALNGLGLRQLL